MSEERLLLVTAPPRSGTLSLARALGAMGLHVGHEAMGRDGSVSCLLGFPSADAGRADMGTHLAGGLERFSFRRVARILRHPLDTIASLAEHRTPGLWRFVERELAPVDRNLSNATLLAEGRQIDLAARTWLVWSEAILKTWGPFRSIDNGRHDRAEIRLEELPASLEKIATWIGCELPPGRFHEHRSQHARLSWEELEREVEPSIYSTVWSWASMEGYV